MNRILQIIVILIAFALIQAHSIEYWVNMTDWYRGPVFSIAIEATALWLWYLRGWVARSFSVLASTLVIGGALFQVSEPLFARMHEAVAQQQLIAISRSEIADHQATLRQYEVNSGMRPGWAPFIEQTRIELDAARTNLRNELQRTVETGMDWRTYFGIALQALVLLVVMVAQVLAVISFRNAIPKQKENRPVTKTRQASALLTKPGKNNPETPAIIDMIDDVHGYTDVTGVEMRKNDFDRRVEMLAKAIKENLPNFGGKQRMLAEQLNIRPADISMALNHITRKALGKETISEKAVQRMEDTLALVPEK